MFVLSATASLFWGQTRGQSSPNAADWPMYAHDYTSTRYSPQTEITPKNVANLKWICTYPLPEASTFESSLVESGDTLYFTTGESTYAIDAVDCRLKWTERHALPAPEPDRTVGAWPSRGNACSVDLETAL